MYICIPIHISYRIYLPVTAAKHIKISKALQYAAWHFLSLFTELPSHSHTLHITEHR